MSDIVIRAERLGKKYIIGHQAQNGSYLSLRDVLMQNAKSLWIKTRDLLQGNPVIRGTPWRRSGRSRM
jgi:lipopolysaccharide transport system ATP-binding protein